MSTPSARSNHSSQEMTPVLALLYDVSVMEGLWEAPCEEILHTCVIGQRGLAVQCGNSSKMYRRNFASCLRSTYRIHRFWSAASTVKGVTADNSIATVRIAYARDCISAPHFIPTATTWNRCADNCQGMIATSSLGCSS
ncbi:hypothetical protein BJV78DRAFT_721693 [Lactifluus subvellereus]|nr:hypothetical protein BJV78DRAFT_721693 [Lactifluus subvellereus]